MKLGVHILPLLQYMSWRAFISDREHFHQYYNLNLMYSLLHEFIVLTYSIISWQLLYLHFQSAQNSLR